MKPKRAKRGGFDKIAAAKPAALQFGRRERNKRDKLNRIKAAARKLFVAKGFDDSTMREIASRAGVGLGTVFLYAANKRDLLFLIANDGLEEAAAAAEGSVNPAAPLLENLLAVFRHHYEFFAQQPILSRLVLREMTFYESGEQARSFQKTRDALIALVGSAINLAMKHGNINSRETPRLIGWTIFCIYQVELRRWLADDDLDLHKGMNRLRRTLNLCMTGLDPPTRHRAAGGHMRAVRAPSRRLRL